MRLREVGLLLQNPRPQPAAEPSATGNVLFAQAPTRRSRRVKRRRAADCWIGGSGERGAPAAPDGCRAASSSGSRSRSRWPTARGCCWRTSRPASSTRRRPDDVIELIQAANASLGTTVVAVTHDAEVGSGARAHDHHQGRARGRGWPRRLRYMVVGRDGTVHLPPDLLDEFRPAHSPRASRAEGGVELRRITNPEAVRGGGTSLRRPRACASNAAGGLSSKASACPCGQVTGWRLSVRPAVGQDQPARRCSPVSPLPARAPCGGRPASSARGRARRHRRGAAGLRAGLRC